MNHSRSGYRIREERYPGASPRYTVTEGDWNRAIYALSGVPFVGDAIRIIDNDRYMSDYLRNTGLTWADVKYPSRVPGAGAEGRFLYGVSRSIVRMYR